ncbi:MAG: TldD/PmbA family protein [Erysipelotrichales bacterium]|nr:TldD/PmbA family protein [Erysipelotrichales bacterium]
MLDKNIAQEVLETLISTGGDFAEIYEEKKHTATYAMLNGKVENANSGTKYGIGLRIYNKYASVYAYTNKNDRESLLKTAKKLSESINESAKITAKQLDKVVYEDKHKITKRPSAYPASYKIDLMKRVNDTILAYDPIIKQAIVRYTEEEQEVLICNTNGLYITDDRVRTRLAMQAVAEENGKMENGNHAPGTHAGLEFYDSIDLEALAKDTARMAKDMFYADECPSGVMDVVIENGFGGVIFHEACGHALEATSVAKNESVFANKIGQKIAADCVSAVDDGTIPNAWGSNNIDDEGNFTKRNLLIENGILKGYLVDQLNGRRMNTPSSGSGRRQGYNFEPTSRMSNTFILNGTDTFEDIIASTSFGLYAKHLGGGSVNPTTGDFNFAVCEGYLIENGKITKPVKGASLVGNGAEVLFKIDKVSNNLAREQGICGSISGSIPTDVGQPTIRVKQMSVGGRGGKL